MHIQFDITKSQEIDYAPQITQKRKRKVKEDYDYEDEMLEREEASDQRVEVEPSIKNFFVYAGELKEAPKRVISKFNASIRKKNKNKIKREAKKLQENNQKSESVKNEKIKLEKKDKNIQPQDNNFKSDEKKSIENIDLDKNEAREEIKTKSNEIYSKSILAEKEVNNKYKFDIREEYTIKNEMIMRYDRKLEENDIYEFFLNSLVIGPVESIEIILKKLNITESKLCDNTYLNEKKEELHSQMCIEELKLRNLETDQYDNTLFEVLIKFIDAYIKSHHLEIYMSKKKRICENTLKKKVKSKVDDIIKDKLVKLKHWPIKLHHYRKRTFFKTNMHYLSCSLSKSDIFDSFDNIS